MSEQEQRSRPLHRRQRLGVVTSDRMQKTIVVRTERTVRHPEYGRVVRQTVSFKAHDERNEAKVGDQVLVAETRPLSKDKRWRLVKIVRRSVTPIEVADVETGVTA